jgi:hypothetical protein
MFRRSFLVELKKMKHTSEDNGKTNENRFVIAVLHEEEELKNNWFSESFVGTGRSGLKPLTMLKLTRFNHLSQEKYQMDLLYVLIPGKPIPELRPKDMFIISSIMMKNSTVTVKEIISIAWRDSWDFLNENSR